MAIKGLHFVATRKAGKPVTWRVYAFRGGPLIKKAIGPTKPALTADDVRAYQDAIEASHKVKADTFAGLIRLYRKSAAWTGLEPSTRKVWTGHLDLIEAKWAQTPLKFWSDPRMLGKIIDWRDSRSATPRSADNGITVLHHLLAWARLSGRVTINLAAGIPKLYQGGDRAEIIWTPADLEAFAKVASPQVMDGADLARLTGFRRADLVSVTFDDVGDAAIVITAKKKSRGKRQRAVAPLLPALAELIARLRTRHRATGVKTLLVNGHGHAWSADGFGQRFSAARDKAGIEFIDDQGKRRAKHLHDLRGTYATELMQIKPRLTDQEIGDLLGWSPKSVDAIRRRYVDGDAIVVALAQRLRQAAL